MNTLLHAIQDKDMTAIREILKWNPKLINAVDDKGIPLSHHAAMTGRLDIVSYVVEYSFASLNTVDPQNRDMLHYAACSGDVYCCRYLVERCTMDPLRADVGLITPYEIARQMGHQALESYFESAVGAPLEDMYKNPIRQGMFPDPSIVRVGDDYYMVNSTFIYFPCIPISHSRDLVNWKVIGHAIVNPQWAQLDGLEGGRGYWAPDISYCDGTYYICATYRHNDDGPIYRRQMVVTATSPAGPYSKPVFFDEDGIDPSIFHDDDGRHYMLLNRGARIFEIDKTATKQLSDATLLYYGDQKRAPEGPHLLKKDGYYYLFLAEGGTGLGHRETVARSKSLFGLYEPCPYGPILRQHDEAALIQRCGHAKPVCTQHGQWYMVYLCGRALEGKYTLLGRETALDPFTWTKDGWPLLNRGKGPSALQRMPFAQCKRDDEIDVDWMTPRAPSPGEIERKNDQINIVGSDYPLHDVRCRSMLLRRQTAFIFSFRATLDLDGLTTGSEAGITCYYDENSYLTLGVRRTGDRYALCVSEQVGLEHISHTPVPINLASDGRVHLSTTADGLRRTLLAATSSQPNAQVVATLPHVAYLSDEGVQLGKRFTGAMVGVYALYGAKAHFTDIQYQA